MNKKNNQPIDIIIPWVDNNDPEWRREKKKYDPHHRAEDIRYENWDNLQYVFRGIEKNMPWVRKVFFVTYGHLPQWLNKDNPKLRIIRHDEYIPTEYLPTFNSNTIEMNYFRIADLSEDFVLFNDDIFVLQPIPSTYFFQDGMPCAEAIETHFVLKYVNKEELWQAHSNINNMVIINKYFDKRQVIRDNYEKWFSSQLGERVRQNKELLYWNNFESFVYPHEAQPIKKSVLEHIWEVEYDMLDTASQNRIREYTDVTQRLISHWQICSGNFIPRKALGKMFHAEKGNVTEIVEAIKDKKYPMICINEESVDDFVVLKEAVNIALAEVFCEKSSFEL